MTGQIVVSVLKWEQLSLDLENTLTYFRHVLHSDISSF